MAVKMIEHNRNTSYKMIIRGSILLLNIFAVCWICMLIMVTTNELCDTYKARDFLNNIVAIPKDAKRLFGECIFMMLVLIITFLIRSIWERKKLSVIWTLMIDILVSCYVIVALDFNYNGLILYVFAEILFYVNENRYRMLFVKIAAVGYLFMDYNMLSLYIPLYNITDYIQCYSYTLQQYLLVILAVVRTLNLVLFIVFCVYIISIQQGTIEEVNRLYSEVQSMNKELKKYSDIAEKMAQTKERNRLAREIHDTLGHTLTGITTGLDACLTLLDISQEDTRKQLQLLAKVSREGVNEVRRSVNELRPDSLERLNLEMAINEMIADMSQVANVRIHFETNGIALKFDEDEEIVLYRVIQESITNSVRHGHAKEIWIVISQDGLLLYLTIRDDGIGCVDIKNGFGTRHIKERIEMLKGTVEFEGNDGFVVKACIPIRWGETYD